MDEQEYDLTVPANQEYDLTVPANREDLIHAIEAVTPKAETLTLYAAQLTGANHKSKI